MESCTKDCLLVAGTAEAGEEVPTRASLRARMRASGAINAGHNNDRKEEPFLLSELFAPTWSCACPLHYNPFTGG